ncbi:MAG: response regulator [Ectothiorhodospiraceae bacterium]|nr:response regulator [Chromatiales bacterium]MCP5154550.1 response regulator [Ectothiorhodospiraceae bacterium]
MSERPDSAPTVVVIEDEGAIRAFLRVSLEAHGFTVVETPRGEDGLAACAQHRPVLVVLDLGLPDVDGLEVVRRLREWSSVPVLVLSVRAEERDKVAALDAGANDFVTKPFGVAELMARVRVLTRPPAVAAANQDPVYRASGLTVNLATHEVAVDGTPVHLTPKEYELLRLLATRAGSVVTHRDLVGEIWGRPRADEIHHLRVLVGHLRSKLGDPPTRPRFVHTVAGVGYRVTGPD